jgi:predicted signal transduction protein with EAL and GGDEF domain
MNTEKTAAIESTTTVKVAIAWLVVGIPLLWGVSQTFMKSLALFH